MVCGEPRQRMIKVCASFIFIGCAEFKNGNIALTNKYKIMKKIILSILTFFTISICVNAQILRAEDLEEYAKEKYGDNWTDAAKKIGETLTLDKNNALTFVQIIDAPNQTKEQLYVALNYWYSSTFNSGKAVIQLNDKDAGVIIGKGFIEGIALHIGAANTFKVSIEPIIKTDIKDGKVRVTYSVPFYSVTTVTGGVVGMLGGMRPTAYNDNWVLDKCFPFVEKDRHKKASAKALVMTHAYSNAIMDKIEDAIKNGVIGNESDNW